MVLKSAVTLCREAGGRVMGGLTRLAKAVHAPIYHVMNHIPNRMDSQRRDALGPNLSCAEWLLRNGACMRWHDAPRMTRDYNGLPSAALYVDMDGKLKADDMVVEGTRLPQFVIEEVYVDEGASLLPFAFAHFEGCNGIKKMSFVGTNLLNDSTLTALLAYEGLRTSLEHFVIKRCIHVSTTGLLKLQYCGALKELELYGLLGVTPDSLGRLKEALPNCSIRHGDSTNTAGDEPPRLT